MGGWQNDSDSFTTGLGEKLARRGAKARFDCGRRCWNQSESVAVLSEESRVPHEEDSSDKGTGYNLIKQSFSPPLNFLSILHSPVCGWAGLH